MLANVVGSAGVLPLAVAFLFFPEAALQIISVQEDIALREPHAVDKLRLLGGALLLCVGVWLSAVAAGSRESAVVSRGLVVVGPVLIATQCVVQFTGRYHAIRATIILVEVMMWLLHIRDLRKFQQGQTPPAR
jgi:uncharacterized membrane protein